MSHLRELLAQVEARIDAHLTDLDTQDTEAQDAPATPGRAALQAKIAQLKERQGNYDDLLGALKERGQNEVSPTHADSRKMMGAHGGHLIGCNVQLAVDAKHHLIVAEDVVPAANDRRQLVPLATAAKAELRVAPLPVVADKGHHQAEQLAACATAGITAHVPAPGTASGKTKDGMSVFPKEKFRCDAAADGDHCPGGHVLPFQKKNLNRGQARSLYYDRAAGRDCALRPDRTTGSCRVNGRHAQEAAVEATATRVQAAPEKVAARKGIVEHVFGTLRLWGHDEFLLKGLGKVKGEFSLSAVVYNLRRVLNLRSVPDLLAAVRTLAVASAGSPLARVAAKTGPREKYWSAAVGTEASGRTSVAIYEPGVERVWARRDGKLAGSPLASEFSHSL